MRRAVLAATPSPTLEDPTNEVDAAVGDGVGEDEHADHQPRTRFPEPWGSHFRFLGTTARTTLNGKPPQLPAERFTHGALFNDHEGEHEDA